MGRDDAIVVGPSLREYFRELVESARSSQGVDVGETSGAYLVNLMAEFVESERLFPAGPDGRRQQEALVSMLRRALEGDPRQQVRELRRLGDTSLWVAGLFEDHVDRRALSPAYYRSMGQNAYAQLSGILDARRQRALGELYGELAANFDRMADLLNEIAERLALGTEKGLLSLYERFRRTGSTRLARLLAEEGLFPSWQTKGVKA